MYRSLALTVFSILLASCGGGGSASTAPPPPPANQAPIAADQSVATNPGVASNGSLSATDANGDALTFAIVAVPASGTVALSGTGSSDFEYTPNGGFVGTDTFTFVANDGSLDSNTATVTVVVNSAPTVNSASFDTSDIVDIAASVNASDAEGDAFTFAVTTTPAKGTLVSFDTATGDFVYSPDPAQDGADSFEVTATDAFQTSQPAAISIEIFGWSGSGLSGGVDSDWAGPKALLPMDDGGFIVGGSTTGSFAGGTNAGGDDAWVRRIDRRGAEVWTRQIGDAAQNRTRSILARPQDDGFYVTTSNDNATVVRFDFDGNILWSVPVDFGGREMDFEGNWNGVDGNGDIYMLSWIRDLLVPDNPINGLVTKISGGDGSIIWHRELLTSQSDPVDPFVADSSRIRPRGVDFDSIGRVVISGGTNSVTGQLRTFITCPFIAKLDPATGADLWVRVPQTFDSCNTTQGGRFYRSKVDVDDTIIVNGSEGGFGSDIVLARFSADATQEIWSVCEDIVTDPDTQLVYSRTEPLVLADGGIADFANRFTYDRNTGALVSAEPTLLKYSSDGIRQWATTLSLLRADGSAAITAAGSIAEDSQGLLYVTGATDGELNGDTSAGSDDAFIERLDANGTPTP